MEKGWLLFDLLVFGAGYAAAVFTWARVRTFLIGAKAEADRLRERLRVIEDKFR